MATQKKTTDVDYSMQEKILALYELQKIDSKIDEINKVKGERVNCLSKCRISKTRWRV